MEPVGQATLLSQANPHYMYVPMDGHAHFRYRTSSALSWWSIIDQGAGGAAGK